MPKNDKTKSRRDIRLLTFVNAAEYGTVLERYRASNAPSLRAYQRQCLLGRSLRPEKSIEVSEAFSHLGEMARTLLLILDRLEEIQERSGFEGSEAQQIFIDLHLSLKLLINEIAEIRQTLIPTAN